MSSGYELENRARAKILLKVRASCLPDLSGPFVLYKGACIYFSLLFLSVFLD